MKRVLILSLGVGNILGKRPNEYFDVDTEDVRKLIESGNYAYNVANYRFDIEEDDKIIKSPFVAEKLIESFKPDYVLVVGTVKSCWSSFILKYADNSEGFAEKLTEVIIKERDYNKDSSEKEMHDFEIEIDELLENYKNNNVPAIKAIILKYGVSENEMNYNYDKLCDALDCVFNRKFSGEEKYEVAFDITHSFRSMTLYNLVVLNYFTKVKKYDIHISNIFYGNLDVSREMNNVAIIVDLNILSNVLNFTNAIMIFQKTGSVIGILECLEYLNPSDEIYDSLKSFEEAVQLNDLVKLEKTINELQVVLSGKSEETQSIYTNMYSLLKESLQNLPSTDEFNRVKNCNEVANKYSYAKLQLKIAKWYSDTNRIGMAIITLQEAFYSVLTELNFKIKDRKGLLESYLKDGNNRLESYNSFLFYTELLMNYINKNASLPENNSIIKKMSEMILLIKNTKVFRNTVAHCLGDEDIDYDYESIRSLFGDISSKLRELIESLLENETEKTLINQYKDIIGKTSRFSLEPIDITNDNKYVICEMVGNRIEELEGYEFKIHKKKNFPGKSIDNIKDEFKKIDVKLTGGKIENKIVYVEKIKPR